MFTIKARFQTPKLNIAAYKRALTDSAVRTITDTAFAWVDVAVSIIPVWSGASVATFTDIAQDIGRQLNIQPVSTAPNRITEGQDASVSGLFIEEAKGTYTFAYATDLTWLVFNEQFNANDGGDPNVFSRLLQPGPYNFQEQATAAAKGRFENFTPPDLRNFITVITTSVG